MKLIFLFAVCLTVLSATGCSKDNDDNIIISDTPRSEVPDELVGKWLNGTFSMSNWYTYDGQYAGNPYSSSRAFSFEKNGNAEFFQVIKTYNGACSTDAFTNYKGTVKFNNDGSFTFYPQQGTYRGFYSCASSSNFNRPATKDEMKSFTLFWKNETHDNGQEYMVTRFGANDPDNQASYFKPTTW